MVGGGTVDNLSLTTYNNVRAFEVAVSLNGEVTNVLLNAQNGELISQERQPVNNIMEVATPSDLITQEETIELVQAYLGSIDVANAHFDYAYLTEENGVQVWSVEFDENDHSYEFYVDATTGEFLKAPSVSGYTPASTPTVTVSGEVSHEDAIGLAQAHLVSMGLENARLEDADLDTENGTQVWHIEFEHGDRDLDFYVRQSDGTFLRSP